MTVPRPRVLFTRDFLNARTAYRGKTKSELFNGWLVLRTSAFVAERAGQYFDLSNRLIGENLTRKVIKHTFFKHFCAGESEAEIAPKLAALRQQGIGTILDYAAEKDIVDDKSPDVEIREDARQCVYSARTFDYEGEEGCEANAQNFRECINSASRTQGGFCAVKLTALGKPTLLKRVSTLLLEVRRVWIAHFFGKDSRVVPLEECRLAVSTSNYKKISRSDFHKIVHQIDASFTGGELDMLFDALDVSKDGELDYLEWSTFLTLEDLSEAHMQQTQGSELQMVRIKFIKALVSKSGLKLVSNHDLQLVKNLHQRLVSLAALAAEKNVKMLIDAEQSYLQVAIDHFTHQLQRVHNKESAVVFNTYQCYLKIGEARVRADIERAKRENYWFAAKIVRGAYMEEENKLARDGGYQSPVFSTIAATHAAYNDSVKLVLQNFEKAELVLGTHNTESIVRCTEVMNQLNSPVDRVHFAQLLGMADHLSFTLAENNYRIYKYVPYGPVKLVIKYLLRRAQENGVVVVNSKAERSMMIREFWRRVFTLS